VVAPGGAILGGRYELLALLATGGMGQVWRGRDAFLGRPVAVKVLRSEYTGDATFLGRFRAEAQHTARLAHPNIATLHDYGEIPAAEGTGEHLAYLVMELVEGESLASLLARERRLSVERTLDVLHQTATALAAAHAAGVVHRDVKPGNVLVGDDGAVKITDFGIAWSASDVPLTQTGQVVGTAHYLSPEQAGGGKAGPASDVYALGAIGYECLAGRRVFEGDNAVQIALRHLTDVPQPLPVDVPDGVRRLIGRALLKDPAERYPDAAAFRDAIAGVRAGAPVPSLPAPSRLPGPQTGARPGTTPLALRAERPAAPPRRRWRRRLAAPAAALLAGAAIGVGVLQLLGDDAHGALVASGAAQLPAPATSGPAPRTVLVDPAGYLGRPVPDVEAELTGLGLRVRTAPQGTAAAAAGVVTSLDPSGTLTVGDEVVVSYAVAPATSAPAAPAPASAAQVALAPAARSGAVPAAPQRAQPAAPSAQAAGAGTGAGGGAKARNGKAKGAGNGKSDGKSSGVGAGGGKKGG
jgi:serine/threonine-protein kinase